MPSDSACSSLQTQEQLQPSCSVLHGKYDVATYDSELGIRHPPRMECYKIVRPYGTLFIPTQVVQVWNRDLIENIENQMMRDADVLLVTAGKAGTHWAWEIINMLLRGDAAYLKESKHRGWLEFLPFQQIVGQQSGRHALNTHTMLSHLPPHFRQRGNKVITCLRNPKDVLVSFYHHFQIFCPKDLRVSFSNVFEFLLKSKQVPFGNVLDHYADIWDNYRNDPDVLIIFYEDLKENTYSTIQRMAQHLNVAYTPQLIADITHASDIRRMKMGKYESETRLRTLYGEDASLFRKGEIGDWRNHFTAEQDQMFDAVFSEWNRSRQIPFRFVPSQEN